MATLLQSFSLFYFFCVVVLVVQAKPFAISTSPYLSPLKFFPDYQKMVESFKIFVYKREKSQTFITPVESLFQDCLLKSPFLTTNGDEAHLYYLSFPTVGLSQNTRQISRLIRDLRTDLPFWNRTLGADHFYVACAGIGIESDRNLVELKKNSVQISCFPAIEGRFIPHKDVTLPPLNRPLLELHPQETMNKTARFIGYYFNNGKGVEGIDAKSTFLTELRGDPEFLIESEPSDHSAERLWGSRFCLFFYGEDVSGIGEALRFGCVPVVISDRPILDLPFMEVFRWSEMAVFVGMEEGVTEMKRALSRLTGDRYRRMKDLGKEASQHFVWNSPPQQYDAFYTVLYQLWLRRHTIRYARRDWI